MIDPTALLPPLSVSRLVRGEPSFPQTKPAPYAAQVQAALRDRLARSDTSPLLHELMANYPERGGRGVRSTLCIATCAALGGVEKDALPFAVAIELLHNAFLVHDDICDGSRLRRGRSALPVEHGVGLAVCAGNALTIEALTAMRAAAEATRVDAVPILAEVERTIRHTLDGQVEELSWERHRRLDVTIADYLAMAVRKTSWYSAVLPCRLGALAASGIMPSDRFLRSGALIGVVLQIADDLQNLLAPDALTGKEAGDDLVEGKRSLPLIHCLETGTELDRRRIAHLLRADREFRDPAAVVEVREVLQRSGSIGYARECAGALAEAARIEFATDVDPVVSVAHLALIDEVLDSLVARCG